MRPSNLTIVFLKQKQHSWTGQKNRERSISDGHEHIKGGWDIGGLTDKQIYELCKQQNPSPPFPAPTLQKCQLLLQHLIYPRNDRRKKGFFFIHSFMFKLPKNIYFVISSAMCDDNLATFVHKHLWTL